MSDIKLYGYATSPFVLKVACFLNYKKLPFTFVPVSPITSEQIAFTEQTQVPVLSIDGEWRKDSTPLGIWLEERFPENPILGNNEQEREKILSIDKWVTDSYITGAFRGRLDAKMTLQYRQQCWRLASLLSCDIPMPEEIRAAWPDLIRGAQFIHDMMEGVDRDEPLDVMFKRLDDELLAHLGDGPYLGGFSQPTLADLSVFPRIALGYLFGLEEHLSISHSPELVSWLHRVAKHLPENPALSPDYMMVNKLVG